MKITWLGQAGLYFETGSLGIMIDPYLSDSVKAINPNNWRRVPVEERLFDLKPQILIFTHNHLDHYDPETVRRFLTPESGITVLCPTSVWNEVRQTGGNNNYVQFDRHTRWTQGGVRFSAVKAQHSDPYAIGILLEAEGKTYYITGDTLYNTDIFADLPATVDAVFLPVNGLGNNMNMTDAADFVQRIGAKRAVPMHIGLFDTLRAEDFHCPCKVIPEFYKQLEL